MPAPELSFRYSANKISDEVGFDSINVTFSSDIEYQAFECRATKNGDEYGVGKGALLASFSYTPSNIERSFSIYDELLTRGDGEYRIALYAQSVDGSWNDLCLFIPFESDGLITSDGKKFFCVRG